MKQRRSNWTFSPDNPTARARTIGRGCWTVLARVDPEAAEKIRAEAAKYGEDVWLTATPNAHVEGDDMTRQQVAERAGVDTPAVVAWGRRGIRRKGCTHYLHTLPGKTVYAEADVNEFLRLRDTPDVRAPRERPLTPCRSTRSATSRAPSTPPAPAADRRSTSTQKA